MDPQALYRWAKLQVSDGACALLKPVTPDLFARSCTRFFDGAMISIELLVLACCAGFALAVLLVLARVSGKPILAAVSYIYCYVFRGTPLLVQLWIFYFGLGALGAQGLGPLWAFFRDGWWVGLLVLTLNTAAYVAEILRGGIANVPKGQVEAAIASGMGWTTRMRRIVFPQALQIAWPAYGNEVILLLKGSALVSTITVMDLMGQIRTVFSRSYSLEIFLYGALMYLALTAILTGLLRLIERRFPAAART
ncbi:MAG: ABC transporter permease [Hyphomicrobiaceae bacterium]